MSLLSTLLSLHSFMAHRSFASLYSQDSLLFTTWCRSLILWEMTWQEACSSTDGGLPSLVSHIRGVEVRNTPSSCSQGELIRAIRDSSFGVRVYHLYRVNGEFKSFCLSALLLSSAGCKEFLQALGTAAPSPMRKVSTVWRTLCSAPLRIMCAVLSCKDS